MLVPFFLTFYHILLNLSFISIYPLQIVDPFFQLSQHRKPMDRQTNFRGVLGSIHHPKLWSVPVNIQKVLCPFNPQMDVFSGKFPLGEKKNMGWRLKTWVWKSKQFWRKRKWLLKRKWRICWDSEFATSLAFWRRCLRMKQDGVQMLVQIFSQRYHALPFVQSQPTRFLFYTFADSSQLHDGQPKPRKTFTLYSRVSDAQAENPKACRCWTDRSCCTPAIHLDGWRHVMVQSPHGFYGIQQNKPWSDMMMPALPINFEVDSVVLPNKATTSQQHPSCSSIQVTKRPKHLIKNTRLPTLHFQVLFEPWYLLLPASLAWKIMRFEKGRFLNQRSRFSEPKFRSEGFCQDFSTI